MSYAHKVCANGKWIAVISTNQENTNAAAGSDAEKAEIAPALNLLGKIDEMFFEVSRHAQRQPYTHALNARISPRPSLLLIRSSAALPHPAHSSIQVVNEYAPSGVDQTASNVFVSSSYDATSHFESATDEVIEMYRKVTGKELDLTIQPDLNEE